MIVLSEAQQRIVEHGQGAMLVLAGPGSGKTRVLTERLRRLIRESQGHFRVLALTFTNKAASEMRERLGEFSDIHQRSFIGTFHSFCLEVLSTRGSAVGLTDLPHIFESLADRSQVLMESAGEDPLLSEVLAGRDQKERSQIVSRWMDAISSAKGSLLFAEDLDDETVRRAYEVYDEGLRRSGAVDFDDLLLLTRRLFLERPKIAEFFRKQFEYLCVDEAQDINPAQFELLLAFCGESYRNVMMVGDPRQAIFSWNGADVRLLDRFATTFDARVERLTENFRSCQAVVQAARALFPKYSVEGQLPVAGEVRCLVGADEADEGRKVAGAIAELLRDGHPDIEGAVTPERCAIIGRTRFTLAGVESELADLGIPYYKQLATAGESESDLLRDFELALRVVSNPRDRLHMRTLLRRWNGDLELPELRHADQVLQHLRGVARSAQDHIVLDAIVVIGDAHNVRFGGAFDVLEQFALRVDEPDERALVLQDLEAWRNHWNGFLRATASERALSAFLASIALGATEQHPGVGAALLTVHSAKGLEFDVVAVVGLNEGTFPDYRARGQALSEENRNAFVAFTRARRVLVLARPKFRRMPWGDQRAQQPSRYFTAVARSLGLS